VVSRRWGIAVVVIACSTAAIRAATAPSASPLYPLDENARKKIFAELVQKEAENRRKALKDWPADPWSEDDHFHHLEMQEVEHVAHQFRTNDSEVLRALDDGVRERWFGDVVRATVPPCRPRPITD